MKKFFIIIATLALLFDIAPKAGATSTSAPQQEVSQLLVEYGSSIDLKPKRKCLPLRVKPTSKYSQMLVTKSATYKAYVIQTDSGVRLSVTAVTEQGACLRTTAHISNGGKATPGEVSLMVGNKARLKCKPFKTAEKAENFTADSSWDGQSAISTINLHGTCPYRLTSTFWTLSGKKVCKVIPFALNFRPKK